MAWPPVDHQDVEDAVDALRTSEDPTTDRVIREWVNGADTWQIRAVANEFRYYKNGVATDYFIRNSEIAGGSAYASALEDDGAYLGYGGNWIVVDASGEFHASLTAATFGTTPVTVGTATDPGHAVTKAVSDAKYSASNRQTAIVNAEVDAAAAIAESKLNLASDAAQGTASRRTIFTGTPSPPGTAAAGNGTSAAAGNHVHARPTSIVNSEIDAAAAIAETKLNLASDAAQGTASRRTISTSTPQALGTGAAGNGTAASASNHVHPTTNVMGYVAHGATAGAARPTGFGVVTWIGSVTPTNAIDGDLFVNTA